MVGISTYIILICWSYGTLNFYGEIPENIPTFLIHIPREQTEFYGGILIQGQWVSDTSLPDLKSKSVEIVIDTPWDFPQIHRRELGHRLEISYEAPVLRKKRLEEGWKKAGFVILDSPQGKKVIRETLYQQAIKAIEMAQSVYQESKPPELLYSPSRTELESSKENYIFIKQWIFHILIVVIGTLSLAFIIWKFLLTPSSS